jgi:hypothetical protein
VDGDTPSMRLARGLSVAVFLSASLVAAVGATAARPVAEDGTLTVRDGRGTLVVRLKGSVIGRLAKGTLTVTDSPDGATIIVRGADKPPRLINDRITAYTGLNLRFRIADDKRVVVRLEGKGINFSAVGRGNGWMDGLGDPAGGIFFDGSYSLNGGPYHSIPDERTRFELVLSPPGSRSGSDAGTRG